MRELVQRRLVGIFSEEARDSFRMNNQRTAGFLNLRIVQLLKRLIVEETFAYVSLDKLALMINCNYYFKDPNVF